MKGLIVLVSLLIAIHATTATIDVKKLKETASPLLQTLTDTASSKLQTLTDKASVKLQTLKEKASMTLQQLQDNAKANLNEFIESIDMEKLKKLDFLNIVPRVQDRLAHKHFPSHSDKLKFLKSLKGLKGKDLILAFDGDYPWPVIRRRIEYIYE